VHVFVVVKDGRDIDRFLKTLHQRCWLKGLGWKMVGAGGQLLERSIVDRSVGGSERLVFEAPPILMPPLAQDAKQRRPEVCHGDVLDTTVACPPLTVIEKSELGTLLTRETQRLAAESAKARADFVEKQSRKLAKRSSMSIAAAERTIIQQCAGTLLPDIELPFDDEKLAGKTVGDVLADPDYFEGETLADPLEGVGYGRGKAKIMRRADGSLWINSFAHGRTVYEMKFNANTVRAALEKVDDSDAIKTLIKLDLIAALDEEEWEQLRNELAKRTGINKMTIERQRKKARKQQAAQRAKEARDRRLAARHDPRSRIDVPALDAEWIPQAAIINESLAKSPARIPPARDMERTVAQVRKRSVPHMHAFTTQNANANGEKNEND
jgi:hypothetical protein